MLLIPSKPTGIEIHSDGGFAGTRSDSVTLAVGSIGYNATILRIHIPPRAVDLANEMALRVEAKKS